MRIQWIDVAKGVGILLVTIGHTNARQLLGGYVGTWISCFHMPLFFVMAGLCFDSERHPRFVGYVKRKLVALGWPFLALTVFMAVLSIPLYWGDDPRFAFIAQLKELLHCSSTINTFWFVKTLFEVEIVYYIMVKMFRSKIVIFSAALFVGAIGIFLIPEGYKPLQFNTLLASLGYYGLGAYVREWVIDHEFHKSHGKILALGCGFLFAYSILVLFMHPFRGGYSVVKLGNPYLFIPLSLMAIAGVSLISVWLINMRLVLHTFLKSVLYVMTWLGANSIIIMAVHGHCGLFAASWSKFGLIGVTAKVVEYVLFATLTWVLATPLNALVRFPRRGGIK